MNAEPKFLLTVPRSLWDSVAQDVSTSFADSNLFGATLRNDHLTPRTLTGYRAMHGNFNLSKFLKTMNITLVRPTPYPGDGTRLSSEQWRP